LTGRWTATIFKEGGKIFTWSPCILQGLKTQQEKKQCHFFKKKF
jgi:hypothetical protein